MMSDRPTEQQIAMHMRGELDKHGDHHTAVVRSCRWYASQVSARVAGWQPIAMAPTRKLLLVWNGQVKYFDRFEPYAGWSLRREPGFIEPTHFIDVPDGPKHG